MKITGIEITRKSRKMSKEELQEHMKNSRQGVGIQRNKKKYTRKQKHKQWQSSYIGGFKMKDILINLYNSQIEGKLVREAEVAYTCCKGHCMTMESISHDMSDTWTVSKLLFQEDTKI